MMPRVVHTSKTGDNRHRPRIAPVEVEITQTLSWISPPSNSDKRRPGDNYSDKPCFCLCVA